MKVIAAEWEEIRRFYTPLLSAFGDCMVVSIGAGGTSIFEELKTGHPHVAVGCRRPSSGSGLKKKSVALVKILPEPVRNFFRYIEHRFLMSFEPEKREVRFKEGDIERIGKFSTILVLDDAIDTGATMKSVMDALRDAGIGGKILAVVFAWTNPHSLVRPDFWYKEAVLVKFPWSRAL